MKNSWTQHSEQNIQLENEQKTHISLRGYTDGTWKDVQYHLPLEKCKLNYNKIRHTSIKTAKIKTSDDNTRYKWGCRETITLLVGVESGTVTLENSLAVFFKTKMDLVYDQQLPS